MITLSSGSGPSRVQASSGTTHWIRDWATAPVEAGGLRVEVDLAASRSRGGVGSKGEISSWTESASWSLNSSRRRYKSSDGETPVST